MENIIYISNNGSYKINIKRNKKNNKIIKENDDKIVILKGRGPAFCAGGDINSMTDFASSDQFDQSMDLISELTKELYLLPKLLITAINGSVAGLGLSLALNSDY